MNHLYGDQYPVSLICRYPMPAHNYVCCWLPIISRHMILCSYSITFSVHGLTHNLIKDGTQSNLCCHTKTITFYNHHLSLPQLSTPVGSHELEFQKLLNMCPLVFWLLCYVGNLKQFHFRRLELENYIYIKEQLNCTRKKTTRSFHNQGQ